jgi:hypothetical protein
MQTDGLITLIRDTEDEYIQEFLVAHQGDITTPDGFTVFCKYPEKTALHICRGGDGKVFQKTRAQRILWAKFILLHPEERIVLKNSQNNNLLFFLTRQRTPHLVVCNKLDGKWNIISSHAVGGKRAEQYRNGTPPYGFYKP